MANYQEAVTALQEQLESARQALPRDVAAAVANRAWSEMLRDRFDVEALVAHLDEELKNDALIKRLQATADKERQQQRQRGRPRKQADINTQETKPTTVRPTFGFGIGKPAPKTAATAPDSTTTA